MGILDDVTIDLKDLGPSIGIAEVETGQIPESIPVANGVLAAGLLRLGERRNSDGKE
jgi:hypothetical protein